MPCILEGKETVDERCNTIAATVGELFTELVEDVTVLPTGFLNTARLEDRDGQRYIITVTPVESD